MVKIYQEDDHQSEEFSQESPSLDSSKQRVIEVYDLESGAGRNNNMCGEIRFSSTSILMQNEK